MMCGKFSKHAFYHTVFIIIIAVAVVLRIACDICDVPFHNIRPVVDTYHSYLFVSPQ